MLRTQRKRNSAYSCRQWKSTLVDKQIEINQVENILDNPKIGVEISERDTQGNETLWALVNDNGYKLRTEQAIQE